MKYFFIFLLAIGIASCNTASTSLDPGYTSELNEWKVNRLEGLKTPLGYLSMVGLYWLQEGENTIGSNADNDIRFPEGLPEFVGSVKKDGDSLSIHINHPEVTIDGTAKNQAKLLPDSEPDYTKMNWQSYYWYLIKRGNQYGIRVKDTLSDMRLSMTALPYFEPTAEWVLEAEYIAPAVNESTTIKNHVGISYQSQVKGRVRFDYNGQPYELIGTNGGDNLLFVVFGDDTNSESTYAGGRFLYVDIPESGNTAKLDFNKAYNPVCALNDFGTCPYPPAQNILDFAVEAGEQKVR